MLLQERIQQRGHGRALARESRSSSAERDRHRPTPTPPTDDAPRTRRPVDELREALLDALREPSSATRVVGSPHRSRATTCGSGSRTDAWRGRPGRRPRPAGLRLLLLPVGHRLAAVAVRQERGRPRSTPPPEPSRRRPIVTGLRRRRDPLPGARPGARRSTATLGVTLKADVPDDDLDASTRGSPRLRRRQLARARGVGDVRHRLRRPPRPAPHLPARPGSRATRCARTSRCWPAMVKPWPGIVDVEPMPGEADDGDERGRGRGGGRR